MEFQEIYRDLESTDPQVQVLAFEQCKICIGQIARIAVESLRKGPNRSLVAERLYWLGPLCVGPLLEIVASDSSDPEEVKILASLALLQFGNKAGIRYLLAAVEQGTNYSPLAANHLARNGIQEAEASILFRLRNCGLEQADEIAALVEALKKLGKSLPIDIQSKIRSYSSLSWALRSLV